MMPGNSIPNCSYQTMTPMRKVSSQSSSRCLTLTKAKPYAPKDSSKIVALRKLDRKAKLPATIFTYTWGIIFALVFGTGMCLGMQVIGSGITGMVIGIIIGIIGMIGCGVNYPIYKKMLENGKKKYAYEIVELAREISESK